MSSSSSLASYIPRLVLERIQRQSAPQDSPAADTMQAALLFADITGFTALTEQLAGHGPSGVEELSQILNRYFSEMIAFIQAEDGDVVKFAGDALMALWPAQSPDGLAAAAKAAGRCALQMQARLHQAEVGPGMRLALRIGLSAGTITAAYIGGAFQRWEFALTGDPVFEVSQAEKLAQPGQVIAAPSIQALLGSGAVLTAQGLPPGHALLSALPAAQPTVPTPPPLVADDPETLRRYVPAAIYSRLSAGHSGWMAELRRVTVLFINLPGFVRQSSLADAQTTMRAMQEALYHYEGSLNKLSVDDKGVTLVGAFGLPPFSHENDPERGLRAALEIRHSLQALGVETAIGITTGPTFCGSIGSDQRREYTMIGSVVNLAARLMQAAGAGILCDSATRQAAEERLSFEHLAPIQVKGRSEAVTVFRPLPAAAAHVEPSHPANGHTLVGRQVEQTALLDALEQLKTDQTPSQVILLEGEPGLGKSALLEHLRQQAELAGLRVLSAASDPIEKNTLYHVWRPLLARLLGLPDINITLEDLAAARQQTMQCLTTDLHARAPLLNSLLALNFPETDLSRSLTGEARAHNLHDLILEIFDCQTGGQPVLLLLEDLHWFDSGSLALTLEAVQHVRPALCVLSLRPFSDVPPSEYTRLLAQPGIQVLRLSPLSTPEAVELACRRLGVQAVPEEVEKLIAGKAEGNPFFAEELCYALRDAGLIQVSAGQCSLMPGVDLHTATLPTTLEGMVTSRIDRLPPQQQLTLKVASVIGRIFSYRVLHDIHPILSDRVRLIEYLAELENLNLTLPETVDPDLSYVFKHAITQDVTYNLLLFAQRRELHAAVARWYEQTYPHDLTPYLAVLAHHYGRAGSTAKTMHYLELAAAASLRNYANPEALRLLLELQRIAAAADAPAVTALRRAGWESGLGQAYKGLGQLEESRQRLEKALRMYGEKVPSSSGGWAGMFIQYALRLRFTKPMPAPDPAQPDALSTRLKIIDAWQELGEIFFYTSEVVGFIGCMQRVVHMVESLGPTANLMQASTAIMFAASLFPPLRSVADYYAKRAVKIANELDSSEQVASGMVTLALYEVGLGQLAAARQHIDSAMEIAAQLGSRRKLAEGATVAGSIVLRQDEPAAALAYFEQAHQIGRRAENVQQIIWGLHGMICVHLLSPAGGALGSAGRINELLAEGQQLQPKIQELIELFRLQAFLGLARQRAGDQAAAEQYCQQALQTIAKSWPPTGHDATEGYIAMSEMALALWRANPNQPAASARCKQVLSSFAGFAGFFPAARPANLYWHGQWEQQRGRLDAARRHYTQSLEYANQLGARRDARLAGQALELLAANP